MDNVNFARIIILYISIVVRQIFLNRLKLYYRNRFQKDFHCCKLFPYLVPFDFFLNNQLLDFNRYIKAKTSLIFDGSNIM